MSHAVSGMVPTFDEFLRMKPQKKAATPLDGWLKITASSKDAVDAAQAALDAAASSEVCSAAAYDEAFQALKSAKQAHAKCLRENPRPTHKKWIDVERAASARKDSPEQRLLQAIFGKGVLNLTPHEITLRTPAGDITFPPSGWLARVATIATRTGATVAGVPVVKKTYGLVTGLVRDEQGIPLPCIVSGMVLAALPPGTPNVYAPATEATAIRENGQVIAVTELVAA